MERGERRGPFVTPTHLSRTLMIGGVGGLTDCGCDILNSGCSAAAVSCADRHLCAVMFAGLTAGDVKRSESILYRLSFL